MTTKQAKPCLLLGVSLVVLLAFGTSSYAESLGDEAAKAALARKAATDAANVQAALQRKCENGGGDWKRGRCITPQDKCKTAGGKWVGGKCDMPPTPQEKCEKKGGDWKKGKCVMPPPESIISERYSQGDLDMAKIQKLIMGEKEESPSRPLSDHEKQRQKIMIDVINDSITSASHYRINGDGTVTDTQRRLMWKQCSEGQSGSGCSGTAAEYKWDDAMSRFGSGVSFAGYSDWRMPTKDELKSLVYCSNGTPTPLPDNEWCSDDGMGFQRHTINLQAFPNTPYGSWWSSTVEGVSSTWDVDFTGGGSVWSNRSSASYVRLVRSGQ